jgi:hypothetical protein
MRRYGFGWIACGAFLFQGGFAVAQGSLDTLEQELNEAKQQHQEVTAQTLASFFSQIDAAMSSPDAAVALYQQAGGVLPDPAPVVTQHAEESATEKEARMALDQANLSALGAVLQVHCGLMHYAALFAVKPDQKGLQNEWVAWLKSAAQTYPQLAVPAGNNGQQPGLQKKKKGRAPGLGGPPPPSLEDIIKAKTMRESIISKFLDFKGWADKEQGGWAVRDLPKFYRANVLEPLRASPTTATLTAWDVFIAMANADEKDNDKWDQFVFPPLQFDRACDDYAVAPGTEKLEALVGLIKANPTYPEVDDWIARVHSLMDDYRMRHGGKATTAENPATAPAPAGIPGGTVTTEQQGDMTIITTHTNSAPLTNAPPAH